MGDGFSKSFRNQKLSYYRCHSLHKLNQKLSSLSHPSQTTMKLLTFNLIISTASAFTSMPNSGFRTELQAGSIFDKMFQPGGGGEKNIEVGKPSIKTKAKKGYSSKKKGRDKWIAGVFNNFEPIHGHGTAEGELDEIKLTQERVLSERKGQYANKNILKKKYSNPEVDHHGEIPMISKNPADLNLKEDEAMWVEEESLHIPSFHIEEAADSLVEKLNTWIDKQASGDNKNLSP
jgi:hypothetical protein